MSAVALTTAVSFSGCSFIFSEGPPPNHQQLPYFDCSTSYAPPVLDTIWGGLNGIGALTALGTSEAEWQSNNTSDRSTVIAVGLIWLAVSGASAVYGYQKVGACRNAKDQYMLRMMHRPQPAPQPNWPPPPGYYPPPGYQQPPPGYQQPPPAQPAPGMQPAQPPPPSTTPPPPKA